MTEKVMDIQMDKLIGFRNHPFQVKDDESLKMLCESIQEYGVLSPLLAGQPQMETMRLYQGIDEKLLL